VPPPQFDFGPAFDFSQHQQQGGPVGSHMGVFDSVQGAQPRWLRGSLKKGVEINRFTLGEGNRVTVSQIQPMATGYADHKPTPWFGMGSGACDPYEQQLEYLTDYLTKQAKKALDLRSRAWYAWLWYPEYRRQGLERRVAAAYALSYVQKAAAFAVNRFNELYREQEPKQRGRFAIYRKHINQLQKISGTLTMQQGQRQKRAAEVVDKNRSRYRAFKVYGLTWLYNQLKRFRIAHRKEESTLQVQQFVEAFYGGLLDLRLDAPPAEVAERFCSQTSTSHPLPLADTTLVPIPPPGGLTPSSGGGGGHVDNHEPLFE
jgi:hypothetical protein